jgi:hypothetical protein
VMLVFGANTAPISSTNAMLVLYSTILRCAQITVLVHEV